MKYFDYILKLLRNCATLARNTTRYLLILLVRGYQFFISPYFPSSCRYYPTCSYYAIDAIKTHGAIKGFCLTAWRLLRCNPWSAGGDDPVPGTSSPGSCKHHSHPEHKEQMSHPVPSTSSNDL